MNSADVAFLWPDAEKGRLFVSDRPILDYERATIKSVFDPEMMCSARCNNNTAAARAQIGMAISNGLQQDEDDVSEWSNADHAFTHAAFDAT